MRKAIKYTPSEEQDAEPPARFTVDSRDNVRPCPSCDLITLAGMPGGKDSICSNCGYKDPCCYD